MWDNDPCDLLYFWICSDEACFMMFASSLGGEIENAISFDLGVVPRGVSTLRIGGG